MKKPSRWRPIWLTPFPAVGLAAVTRPYYLFGMRWGCVTLFRDLDGKCRKVWSAMIGDHCERNIFS